MVITIAYRRWNWKSILDVSYYWFWVFVNLFLQLTLLYAIGNTIPQGLVHEETAGSDGTVMIQGFCVQTIQEEGSDHECRDNTFFLFYFIIFFFWIFFFFFEFARKLIPNSTMTNIQRHTHTHATEQHNTNGYLQLNF